MNVADCRMLAFPSRTPDSTPSRVSLVTLPKLHASHASVLKKYDMFSEMVGVFARSYIHRSLGLVPPAEVSQTDAAITLAFKSEFRCPSDALDNLSALQKTLRNRGELFVISNWSYSLPPDRMYDMHVAYLRYVSNYTVPVSNKMLSNAGLDDVWSELTSTFSYLYQFSEAQAKWIAYTGSRQRPPIYRMMRDRSFTDAGTPLVNLMAIRAYTGLMSFYKAKTRVNMSRPGRRPVLVTQVEDAWVQYYKDISRRPDRYGLKLALYEFRKIVADAPFYP